jgi:hypothetical protein
MICTVTALKLVVNALLKEAEMKEEKLEQEVMRRPARMICSA